MASENFANVDDIIYAGRPIPANVTKVLDCDGEPWGVANADVPQQLADRRWIYRGDGDPGIRTDDELSGWLAPLTVAEVTPGSQPGPAAGGVIDVTRVVEGGGEGIRTYVEALQAEAPPAPGITPNVHTTPEFAKQLLELVAQYGGASYNEGAADGGPLQYGNPGAAGRSEALYKQIEALMLPREPRRFARVVIDPAPENLRTVRDADSGEIYDRLPNVDSIWQERACPNAQPVEWVKLRTSSDLVEVVEP